MNNFTPKVQILNVFVNEKNEFGNPLGVVIDEQNSINDIERLQICLSTICSEVVFIDDIKDCSISIFSRTGKIPFSGYASLGVAAYLDQLNKAKTKIIHSMGTEIFVKHENSIIWVKAKLTSMPPWNIQKFEDLSTLSKLTLADTKEFEHSITWSWEDEKSNIIRARTFAPDWLIPEDEANGSGSMLLTAKLQKDLFIHHGKGSIIYTKYINSGEVELGGRVLKILDKDLS